MKKCIFVSLAAILTMAAFGEAPKRKLTPQQIEDRKYRHFGGHIYQQRETKLISISNEQQALPEAALVKIAAEMQGILMLPVTVNAKDKIGLTLRVCMGCKETPLVVMPDNAAATVNIAALSADKPSPEVLENRVCKELWRGLIYTLGGGNTYVQQCVMKQISSLPELDALPSRTACPDAFIRVSESAKALGIQSARRVTYRQACKEGWAPAPTNDVQQAIWDEVHAIPATPMKIEFDPKKGR